MTAKEKAQELIDKFLPITNHRMYSKKYAKLSALIAVEEIIKVAPYKKLLPHLINTETVEFWEEVKLEIEKL